MNSEVVQHSARAHAILSASGSERWINCPGSVYLSKDIPNESSEFANEGTFAHELAEIKLRYFLAQDADKYNERITELYNTPDWGKYYSESLNMFVDKYVSYVWERYNAIPDAKLSVEVSVPINYSTGEQGARGTSDAIIFSPSSLTVVDLKFGMGVQVEAENNTQGLTYAYGALCYLHEAGVDINKIESVTILIVQPRLDYISEWTISVRELCEWVTGVSIPQAEKARNYAQEYKCGKWCKFCPAKPLCATVANEALKAAQYEFAPAQQLVTDGRLTDNDIVELLGKRDIIIDWFNSVLEYAEKEALKGKDWPGYKLVNGRSTRIISDENALACLLWPTFGAEIYNPATLKGLPALEKLVGKDELKTLAGNLIKSKKGKPCLKPESNRKKALDLTEDAKNDFITT